MKIIFKFIFILCLFSFVACDQNELWKESTTLTFSIGINPQGSNGGPGDLTFNDGYILLANMRVEGKMETGEIFTYDRNFPTGLRIPFLGVTPLSELKFSMPQGQYQSLKLYFDTYSASSSNDIYVEGTFVYNNPNKAPAVVKLDIETAKQFEVNVTDENGNQSFNLLKGVFKDPIIILDPPYWFRNITSSIMNGSNTTMVGGQSIITISTSSNPNIFSNIDSEVGKNTKSIIQKK